MWGKQIKNRTGKSTLYDMKKKIGSNWGMFLIVREKQTGTDKSTRLRHEKNRIKLGYVPNSERKKD